MRGCRPTLLPLAALLWPATGAAQEAAPEVPEAPAAESVAEPVELPDDLPPAGPQMRVVDGSQEALTLYPRGSEMPQSAYLCLPPESGFLVLRRADNERLVLGENGCNLIIEGSPEPDGPRDFMPLVVRSQGPDAARFPVGKAVSATQTICLETGSQITVLERRGALALSGPGCTSIADRTAQLVAAARDREAMQKRVRRPASRVRAGAVGAAPPPAPGRGREMMVVIRGAEASLRFYPRGSTVPVSGRICLPEGDGFLTFQRLSGGVVTYGGGGCNLAIETPPDSGDRAGAGSGP